jgi:hypothetical protein
MSKTKVSNPNNCGTCKHKQNPDGGWCYMFRNEPDDVCMQHTYRAELTSNAEQAIIRIATGCSFE